MVSLEQSCLGHLVATNTYPIRGLGASIEAITQGYAEDDCHAAAAVCSALRKEEDPAELNQAGLVGSRRTRMLFSARIGRSVLIRKGAIDLLDE